MDAFEIIPLIVGAGFCIVAGLMLFSAAKGGATWVNNNNSEVVSTPARVVAKRTHVYSGGDSPSRTNYFVTFEQEETGERLELKVPARTYGLIAERDEGVLTYQGTRYKDFERGTE